MTSEDFHSGLQLLINALSSGEITYEEYTERYVVLLELFEREDEV